MKTHPFISIVIPSRQLNKYLLDENFPAINNLSYNKFEAIVLTSESSKNMKVLLKKYPWLKIISTKQEMKPAEKRNLGVKIARGEIVAFIDDDAYPSKNWLSKSVSLFNSSKIVAVCGPGVLPKITNLWEKIFDEVLKSWIGSGGYSYRFTKQKKRFIDDYPSMNFLIKKSVFSKLEGFNNDYWPGEDSKLCEDIVYRENGKILYDPEVLVYHHRRNNLLGFLKQHGNYGFHRGAFFVHGDRNSRRISYLIPSFFISYLFIFFIFPSNFLLFFPLMLYLFLMFYLFIVAAVNTKNLLIAFFTLPVLFLNHATYGIMFIKGFFTSLINKENIYNEKN